MRHNFNDYREITLKINDKTELYFGRKVYSIDKNIVNYKKDFFTKCPVCDDKHQIEVNGYNFTCPYCSSGSLRNDNSRITLYNYRVCEYIVNELKLEGSTTKSDYKNPEEYIVPSVHWSAFKRSGGGEYNVYYSVSKSLYNNIIKNTELVMKIGENIDIHRDYSDEFVFLVRSDADKFCKLLHEKQKKALKEYNKRNGTDYEYPF